MIELSEDSGDGTYIPANDNVKQHELRQTPEPSLIDLVWRLRVEQLRRRHVDEP